MTQKEFRKLMRELYNNSQLFIESGMDIDDWVNWKWNINQLKQYR